MSSTLTRLFGYFQGGATGWQAGAMAPRDYFFLEKNPLKFVDLPINLADFSYMLPSNLCDVHLAPLILYSWLRP
jgi:hypothetical protein